MKQDYLNLLGGDQLLPSYQDGAIQPSTYLNLDSELVCLGHCVIMNIRPLRGHRDRVDHSEWCQLFKIMITHLRYLFFRCASISRLYPCQ